MAQKKLPKLKVGDFCSIFWDDASSPGRTFIPDEDLPMAELVSHGVVRHISDRRVFIRQEEDLSVDAGKNGHEMKEGVLIPVGCITRIVVYRKVGDATL
jgi:hypothetical protein